MPSKSREHHRPRDRGSDDQSSEGTEGTAKPSHSSRSREKDKDRHSRTTHTSSHSSSKRTRPRSDKDRLKDEVGRSPNSPASNLKIKKHPSTTLMSETNESKVSTPYPSFSKAHSKEAVGSRDNLGIRLNILTPEPTDLTSAEAKKDEHKPSFTTEDKTQSKRHSQSTRPPSPPLTNDDTELPRRKSTPSNDGRRSEEKETPSKSSGEAKKHRSSRSHSTRSSAGIYKKLSDQTLKTSTRTRSSTPTKLKIFEALQFSHRSSPTSAHRKSKSSLNRKSASPAEVESDNEIIDETVDSDATSIAPVQVKTTEQLPKLRNRPRASRPPSHASPSPRPDVLTQETLRDPSAASPPPPPPPPPPEIPLSRPRVDYLLQNGGLPYHVPRNFLGAGESANMPQHLFEPAKTGMKLFEPFSKLLSDYSRVIEKNGSLAVATGYRSVARRLLDRLESVFARDISSESCECPMCCGREENEVQPGVSWGEVLELVSGRGELPAWPPFRMQPELDPATIENTQEHIPMQKLDIDVPEEYRDHYIRQSRKTKQAVDKWLSRQPDQPSEPPGEVDDETLTFAILTYLDPEQRAPFASLLEFPLGPAVPKKETPKPPDRPPCLVLGAVAICRLYRLQSLPRDPETALYMVKHPDMHNVLATLAAISDDEWDILISGRFDGFLRSGAEDNSVPTSVTEPPFDPHSGLPRNGNQTMRSASQPRAGASISSAAAGSYGAPISIDEETEIAALAEVERDIFLGMEALEDAFEILHGKAEMVRRALRERGAGLTAASQARRGCRSNIQILAGTPVPMGTPAEFESGTDEDVDDGASIAPSESASNISSNRRRRPKRRTERRTPAPVEEEPDEYNEYVVPIRPGK
ncbi:hypothetical protein H109_01368 [Trichophyton interdigitale MR816]|uniref:5-Methylcytosine G/T mismatch-specific DNA glycosylase n=1 Tax=Trichophyton interdigitale (strain MR816) TaxID=1215338 RepID=A0A059JG57_TRIIM|nr:hypothetical protein H109_01368 [Trichophyton interdigitale MR816]